jgi:ArsR family transcriptional regulator
MEHVLKKAKGLADGNRLRVVAALMERDELCVCEITEMLGLAMATVSRHMSVLQNADLVRSRKSGRWVYYRLSPAFPILLREWLASSLADSPEIGEDRHILGCFVKSKPKKICDKRKGSQP